MKERLLILCNVFDDSTRIDRNILTDSPAESRKMLMMCHALKLAGVRPLVISLGRGKASGAFNFFSSIFRRVNGIPIFYLPFSHLYFLSECISLFAPLGLIFKFRSQQKRAIIFYNRRVIYLPALLISSFYGYSTILDLEDGEVGANGNENKRFFSLIVRKLFDHFINRGALLACDALSSYTKTRPVLSYYGTTFAENNIKKFRSNKLFFLMGGTINFETGAKLLINVIRKIRTNNSPWANRIVFEITGKGDGIKAFKLLASEEKNPKVIVHGRTTDNEYREILARSDVGLALKLNSGPLANTTFPSKVIELAAEGILVVTTDISDVRQVLGNGAYYVINDEPQELIDIIEYIANNKIESQKRARLGQQNVLALCDPRESGKRITDFIFGRF